MITARLGRGVESVPGEDLPFQGGEEGFRSGVIDDSTRPIDCRIRRLAQSWVNEPAVDPHQRWLAHGSRSEVALRFASSPNGKHTPLVMSVYLSGRASALARILRFPVASVHSIHPEEQTEGDGGHYLNPVCHEPAWSRHLQLR
jgi:hypothetical protein